MSDLALFAAFGSVTEDDGVRVVAFAASEDPEDGYVFVQQDMADPTAPLYLEVSDEIFGGHDALQGSVFGEGLITLEIRPDMVMRFGAIDRVQIHLDAGTEGGAEAMAALRVMLG